MSKTIHYDGKIELMFDAKAHHYTVNGETVDGVTSILKVINKPALTYWAANMGAEFLERTLDIGKPIDEIEKKALVEGVKTAHRKFLKKAGDYGTLLHEWIEAYIKGENPVEPTNKKLKEATKQFLAWIKKHNVKFLASEKRVFSLKYKFCGTFDFLAEVDGKTVLGDLKTSSGIYDEMFLQVNAYKAAFLEEFPDKKIDHTLIMRCGKDGSFEVKEANDFEQNYNAFIAALILYRRLKEMKFTKYINNNQ